MGPFGDSLAGQRFLHAGHAREDPKLIFSFAGVISGAAANLPGVHEASFERKDWTVPVGHGFHALEGATLSGFCS
jgi:ABC-type uncharacterized transport system permease subunit